MSTQTVSNPGAGRLPRAITTGQRRSRDLVCLSHLRWDFVFQRPQHLLSRAAADRRVFYIEEPVASTGTAHMEVLQRLPQLSVVVPHLPTGLELADQDRLLTTLIDETLRQQSVQDFVLWYYTPWALRYTQQLNPLVTVYDCMDELSLFRGADPGLIDLEAQLFRQADLVFTGGQSLYEAKQGRHPSVHLFPSSIDRAHFGKARSQPADPADQAAIPHPRLGFFGVVDERMDLDLVNALAQAHADWHLVLIGPVAKIDPSTLPRRPNIHYLGGKPYGDLPDYLGNWDVALMPFARNEATRFISPTKTPEYLAGGVPVVSTPIRDVVRPYGQEGLVRIAETATEFAAAVEAALAETGAERARWRADVDTFLADNSWDLTWQRMDALIEECSDPEPADGP